MITTRTDINKNTFAGTKSSLTYNKRALWHMAKDAALRKSIKQDHKISSDIKSVMTIQEGLMRPLVDPYNPRIHKTSIVDIKKRIASRNILKKGQVDNRNMERYVQKVKVYSLKNNEGITVAKKLEHKPWQQVMLPYGGR